MKKAITGEMTTFNKITLSILSTALVGVSFGLGIVNSEVGRLNKEIEIRDNDIETRDKRIEDLKPKENYLSTKEDELIIKDRDIKEEREKLEKDKTEIAKRETKLKEEEKDATSFWATVQCDGWHSYCWIYDKTYVSLQGKYKNKITFRKN